MKCLIDMDGVTANFVKGICDLYGVDENDYPKGSYSFQLGFLGAKSENAVWELINEKSPAFWYNLELLPDAKQIVATCEEYFGEENCAFLTSPNKNGYGTVAGKLYWTETHFPKYTRKLIMASCKEFCAHKDSVLVDDYYVNTEKFIKHGGNAILVPRRWNNEHDLDTLKYLGIRIRNTINGGLQF